jgi:hypothetical protein
MPQQFHSRYGHKADAAKSAKSDKAPAEDATAKKTAEKPVTASASSTGTKDATSEKKEAAPATTTAAKVTPADTGVGELEADIAVLPPHLQEMLRNQQLALKARNQAETNPGTKSPDVAAASTAVVASISSGPPAGSAESPTGENAVQPPPAPSPQPAPASTAAAPSSAVQLASSTEVASKAKVPVRMSLSDSDSEPSKEPSPSAQSVSAVHSAATTPAPSDTTNAVHVEVPATPVEHPTVLNENESKVSPASVATSRTKEIERTEAIRIATASIEKELAENPSMDPRLRLNYELALRMMHLSNNDLEQALKPIEHLQPAEQEYYRYQLQALYDSGNPEAIPVASRRWSLVMENQRKANQHLAEISNLEVRNAAFCTDVQGYGVVTKFQSTMFKPDQDVLLYCELENVSSEQIRDGFETQLQGSYEIVDAQGRRVAEQLLPMEKEVCSNQRRDYFVVYLVPMPMQIAAGNYEMRVTIEDLKGKKFGQSNLAFQIQN